MDSPVREEIDFITQRFLNDFYQGQPWDYRLDVVSFASHWTLNCIYVKFLARDYRTLGFVAPPNTYVDNSYFPFPIVPGRIYLESSLQEQSNQYKKRFVICHEVIHYLVDLLDDHSVYQIPTLGEETYTNLLAISFLLPEQNVRQMVRHKFPVYILNGHYHFLPKEDHQIANLQRLFGVPRNIVVSRLQQMHLLTYLTASEYQLQTRIHQQHFKERECLYA